MCLLSNHCNLFFIKSLHNHVYSKMPSVVRLSLLLLLLNVGVVQAYTPPRPIPPSGTSRRHKKRHVSRTTVLDQLSNCCINVPCQNAAGKSITTSSSSSSSSNGLSRSDLVKGVVWTGVLSAAGATSSVLAQEVGLWAGYSYRRRSKGRVIIYRSSLTSLHFHIGTHEQDVVVRKGSRLSERIFDTARRTYFPVERERLQHNKGLANRIIAVGEIHTDDGHHHAQYSILRVSRRANHSFYERMQTELSLHGGTYLSPHYLICIILPLRRLIKDVTQGN